MSWNGSGVFSRLYSWVADSGSGINIVPSRMDADTNDIVSGLNNCLTRDGQGKPSADLSMNGFKLTALAAATLAADAPRFDQLPSSGNLLPIASGGTGAGTAGAALAALGASPRATRIDVASVAGTVDLTANAPNTDDIRITGALAITGFTVATDRVLRVTAGGAFTLTNNASIVTQTGANIVAAAGDTFMLRATAANTVEVLGYASAVGTVTIGGSQVVTGSKTFSGTTTFSSAPVFSAGISGLTVTQANQTPLPGTASLGSYTHGLGVVPVSAELEVVCLTAESSYSVGDVLTNVFVDSGAQLTPPTIRKTATTVSFITGNNTGLQVINFSGAKFTLTPANWAYRFKVRTS